MKIVLVSVDDHTIGIQTAAAMLTAAGHSSHLFYLPSRLAEYPAHIERAILKAIGKIVTHDQRFAIGLHLKELSASRALQLARAARREFGERATLFAGGTYAMGAQEEISGIFDHIIIGSAEGMIPMVQNAEGHGTSITMPQSTFVYPDFSEAYVLDESGNIARRHRRPLVHPQYRHRSALELMLEVGCSYSCSFCEVAALRQLFGPGYRILRADPARAIEIIQCELDRSPETDYVYFFDEDFLLKSEKWINTFSSLYAKIGLPFFVFATPRSITRGKSKLDALAAVGLDTVNVGVQSGSKRIARELFGRKEDRAEVISMIETLTSLYRLGRMTSPPMVDFIILNPYETPADTMQTINLMRTLPLPFQAVMHSMSFFRGTPLYAKATAEGVIPRDYRFRFDLHDWKSRVANNELRRDYSLRSDLEWLKYNVTLAGMNGIHGESCRGFFTDNEIDLLLETEMSMPEIQNLIAKLPDPMDKIVFSWEQAYTKGVRDE